MIKTLSGIAVGATSGTSTEKQAVTSAEILSLMVEVENLRNILNVSKISVNEGKRLLEKEIIYKNGEVYKTAVIPTFQNIADAIKTLGAIGALGIKSTRMNVKAPFSKVIPVSETFDLKKLAFGIIEHVPSETQQVLNMEFDNSDSSNFLENDYIKFDGQMKIKSGVEFEPKSVIDANTTIDEAEVKFNDISVFFSTSEEYIKCLISVGQTVIPSGSVDVDSIESVKGLKIVYKRSGKSILKYALSFDDGVTFYSLYNNAWIEVDVEDKSAFKAKGMTPEILNSLHFTKLEELRSICGFVNKFRCAYYLERPVFEDLCENDKLTMDVVTLTKPVMLNKSYYTVTYNEQAETVTYSITKDGNYTLNQSEI